MAKNGYSFTNGKYDPVKQINVVPEQEKSNARILASEEQWLADMNARDDALVEKTRSEWESVTNLTSKGTDWLKQKNEKDKKDKLQSGAALAIKIPASKEDIQALVAQEDGLHDAHLKISEIADRIEEETGSFELAEEFRNLSGWEQYAYVKSSLQRAAGTYTDFKNERRETITLKDKKTGNDITYDNANEAQRKGLDSKMRHEFSEQFIGVNEKLLAATVAPEVLKVDNAEIVEARNERNTEAKAFKKDKELRSIEELITTDSEQSLNDVNKWLARNEGTYGRSGARLAFRTRVVDLVKSGKLSYVEAKALVEQKFFHDGDKKEVTLEKFKEFEGFADELKAANTDYRKTKLDDDKYEVEANAESLLEEINKSGTELSLEQKRKYLKKRKKEFPNVPLNEMENQFLYGYRDDDVMRQELMQKAESFGGITEEDLKRASPKLRIEMKQGGYLVAGVEQEIANMGQVPEAARKQLTDLVSNSSKATGALDAKPTQYYALLDASEDVFIATYNDAIRNGVEPDRAIKEAQSAVILKHGEINSAGVSWIDENSKFVATTREKGYERKLVNAKRNLDPENAGYATRLLEAPQEQQDELSRWAANGGKGQVPYYYRAICKGTNILPRELAWAQAKINGYEGQWDEAEAVKEFKVPKSLVTLFLNNSPTKNGKKRFSHDVETLTNDNNNEEEVHPYEENEDID